jgi:hypothetical protein
VLPLPIVPHVEELANRATGRVPRLERPVVQQFLRERGEETVDSTGRCNSRRKLFRRGRNAKGLSRPRVESARDAIEVSLRKAGQVGSLRQVLADETVGVLVRPALPLALRIAEVRFRG